MKITKIFRRLSLFLLLFPLLALEDGKKEKVLCEVIQQGLETWHVAPHPLNDELSRKSFSLFQKSLDASKSFLLESDIRRLQPFDTRIDEEMNSGKLDLPKLGEQILHERILQVQAFCRDILSRPLNFSQKDWIEMEAEKRDYCKTSEELKSWWKRQLKYFALIRYMNAEKTNPSAAGKKEPKLSPAKLEEKVRKEVATSMERFFYRILQERPEEMRARFLNAVIAAFDPHSRYFLPRDKEDFDIEMSGTLEGIGVLLGEEDGYIKVLDVLPGSPAWIQNQIKVEDVLLKVGQADEEPVDVVGMPVSDVARLVRGKKATSVRLTLRKPDGRIFEVHLVRNIIEIQETYARSALLVSEPLSARVGYIYLPKFYRDFNRENGRSSSDDVRKELETLKKLNPQGIILDLRNNSGGALDDAVQMAGLFIEKGPIVQTKDRRSSLRLLSDDNPALVYDGPLVILVNALSASASEILGAALQDYGRAVIIGGAHTFGKGTVQLLVDLDRVLTGDMLDLRPLGAVTLTVQRYYRISGGTTQYRGIVSDIVLPEPSSFLEIGEKYLENALPWDTVAAVPFPRWKGPPYEMGEILRRSRDRLQKNKLYAKLNESYQWLQSKRNRDRISLRLEDFRREQKTLWRRAEDIAKLERMGPVLKVLDSLGQAPEEASPKLNSDQARKVEWQKSLVNDLTLDEAVRVIHDMALQPKKT